MCRTPGPARRSPRCVTLKDGADATESETAGLRRGAIAAYKYPRVVRFGPLPKGPTGKILKREIKIDL